MKPTVNIKSAFQEYKKAGVLKTVRKARRNKSVKKNKKGITKSQVSINVISSERTGIAKKTKTNTDQTELIYSSSNVPSDTYIIAKSKNKKVKTFSNYKSDNSVKLEIQKVSFYDTPQLTFKWLIAPMPDTEFFNIWWEKSPFYLSRNFSNYYNEILTTERLDNILRSNSLCYTQNIDVVTYENGKRETHNPEGVVYPAVLWDFYKNKCSIRVLNPHTYSHKLHTLIATLQEFFGCMVGVNAYLTPQGSQGFAPHYDDIEAFVLQLEGRKHWKLYAPLTGAEILPRYSSKNFDRDELNAPIKELTLQAGDLLYFPRGIIHEGYTDADSHSLHITISVYQKNAYIDLLEHALKSALTVAAEQDIQYRKGLPLHYLKHTGVVNSQVTSSVRDEIVDNVKKLITRLTEYVSVDSAADQLGKQFMWDAMPPVASAVDKTCMVYENSDRIQNGIVSNQVSITLNVKVRLLSYYCLRVVTDVDNKETVRVYYCTENAKYYHGFEQQFLLIDKGMLPAIQFLTHNYPKYVEVVEIPLEEDDSKMQFVSDLWERGLLVTEKPLESFD